MPHLRFVYSSIILPAALVALGFTFPQVSAAATSTPFVPLTTTTPIAASQDRLVWSEYDANAKAYTLKSKVGNEVTNLPIATRTIPFDVDLGSDQSGNTVAVYSRCDTEPKTTDKTSDLYSYYQEWRKASGCRVYQFDLQSSQESGLSLGRNGYSTVEPSIANGKVAYISFKDGRYSRGQRVYQQIPGGKAQLQKTIGKTATTTGCIDYQIGNSQKERNSTAKCVRTAKEIFTNLELSGNRLAIAAYFDAANTFDHLEVGTGSRFKAVAYGGGAVAIHAIASPQFAGSSVYFARTCDGGECLSKTLQVGRYGLTSRKLEYAVVKNMGTIAVAGSNIYYVNSGPFDGVWSQCSASSSARCGIRQLTSLHFKSVKPGNKNPH